jgi:5-methylcytosine-specific restriction endonuclease McrA
MSDHKDILTLDRYWQPHQWIPKTKAIELEAKNLVLEHLGESLFVYHGGINARTGQRSFIETSSIIVVDGEPSKKHFKVPALTNAGLFQRDLCICAYCGMQYNFGELTRDHIHPVSKGGKDTWMNVVTACRDCNSLKGDTLPGQLLPVYGGVRNLGPQGTGKMDPLYLPYVPCRAEYMLLKNRKIKFDQMKFLLGRIKNEKSRVFDYAKELFGKDILV